jgi:hypothetical protein
LQKQAKTYNEQMAREKESSDSQVASLKADLRNRATSNDLSLIPAAAEAELQKKLSGELDKRLNAETQRNSRQLDRILTNKQQEVIDVVADSQDTLSKYTRKNATERQMERSELLGHIADTEFMRDTKIRETERSANRSMELLERNYALAIERQRRDYEELLNTQKNDATLRLQTVQQQNEFERKMGQRAFSVSQNELIRNYEKRITDQKSEADAALYDLKVQADQKLREAEKRSKTLLEEQSRSYEQRLAQMEQTQSERERLLAANHREDLEKVQRAHALSQQRQKS